MDPRCSSRCARVGALVLAVVAASSVAVAGQLYRWTDAEGRTVYSDHPPADRKVDRVIQPAPAPAGDPQDLAKAEQAFRDRMRERTEAATEATKVATESTRREEECVRLRGQIEYLKTATYAYQLDANGNRTQLDEAGRKRALDERESFVAKNCAR